VVLKRVTENGMVTFQLQFTWDECRKQGGTAQPKGQHTVTDAPQATTHRTTNQYRATRAAFTAEEDNLAIKLKEDGLPWKDIHKQFTEFFPGWRTVVALQVQYCTKLKGRQ
jgi:hypothetical protein